MFSQQDLFFPYKILGRAYLRVQLPLTAIILANANADELNKSMINLLCYFIKCPKEIKVKLLTLKIPLLQSHNPV